MHVIKLLFPPGGLLGPSVVAQEGHGEQRLMRLTVSLGSKAEDWGSSGEVACARNRSLPGRERGAWAGRSSEGTEGLSAGLG